MLVTTALASCVLCESHLKLLVQAVLRLIQNIFEDINEYLIEYPCEFHRAYWTLQ